MWDMAEQADRDLLRRYAEGVVGQIARCYLEEYYKILSTITEVHSQHADDLCWLPSDVNKIFVAAGLPPQDLRVGDKEAMRKNCDRYLACLSEGGPWKSYAELEKENEELRVEVDHLMNKISYHNPLWRLEE